MSAASLHRRLLFVTALGLYAAVFVAFWLFEIPGLGVAHFFYIPIALLALSGGTWLGLAGGGLATALYALAILVTPRVPSGDVVTYATAIRFVNYTCCGLLVGWFGIDLSLLRYHAQRRRAILRVTWPRVRSRLRTPASRV